MVESVTRDNLTEKYLSRLGLEADPFGGAFKRAFFFEAASRGTILEQLIHYCRFSSQALMLLGDEGSGKSVLIHELTRQLQASMDCCRVHAEDNDPPAVLLSAIATRLALNLSADISITSVLEALQRLGGVDVSNEPILVIVERAHRLLPESIETLGRLHGESQGAVHLLIVADKGAERTAALGNTFARALQRFELPSLSKAELGDYIIACLRSVGYLGGQPLSTDQIAVLHEQSGGNIAAIRRLVPALLASGTTTKDKNFALSIPTAHLVALTVLGGALLASFWYQQRIPSTTTRSVEIAIPLKAPDLTESQEAVKSIEAFTKPPLKSVQPEVVSTRVQGLETVPGGEPVQVSPVSESQNNPVEPPPSVSHVSNDIAHQARYLMKMPTSAYLLQLLGARNEQSAQNLVKSYADDLPITYFATELGKKPWYVVVTGPYDNRDQALVAIKDLPKALQAMKPWARSVGSVQSGIEQQRQSRVN